MKHDAGGCVNHPIGEQPLRPCVWEEGWGGLRGGGESIPELSKSLLPDSSSGFIHMTVPSLLLDPKVQGSQGHEENQLRGAIAILSLDMEAVA